MRLDLYHHQAGAHYLEDILGELEEHRSKFDRLRAGQESIMADLTRLNAAVAAAIAYINQLKSAPPPAEDPAIQAGADAAAAALEAVLPPAPPA